MAPTNRIRRPGTGEFVAQEAAALVGSLARTLHALVAAVHNSAIGVAFYDRRLQCLAWNPSFVALCPSGLETSLGKPLQHCFGVQAKQLESHFKRAFSAGKVIPNIAIAPASGVHAAEPLLLTLYPLRDGAPASAVVAATLCQAPFPESPEFRLAYLAAKFQEGLLPATSVSGSDFTESLARSLQTAGAFLHTLKTALPIGSPLVSAQLESGLLPLALFLGLTAPTSGASGSEPAHSANGEASTTEPASAGKLPLTEVPSARELQVLHHLAIGQSNKEIGRALGISTRTVETYRARIIRKLSLHSTAELVRYAIRHKIIDL